MCPRAPGDLRDCRERSRIADADKGVDMNIPRLVSENELAMGVEFRLAEGVRMSKVAARAHPTYKSDGLYLKATLRFDRPCSRM